MWLGGCDGGVLTTLGGCDDRRLLYRRSYIPYFWYMYSGSCITNLCAEEILLWHSLHVGS